MEHATDSPLHRYLLKHVKASPIKLGLCRPYLNKRVKYNIAKSENIYPFILEIKPHRVDTLIKVGTC